MIGSKRSKSPYAWAMASWAVGLLVLWGLALDRVQAASETTPADMESLVSQASTRSPPWDGPTTGPKGLRGQRIAVIAEDLRNGGILGVAQGVAEAVGVLGWDLKLFDAGGTPEGRKKAVVDALAFKPDGVILDGADVETMRRGLTPIVSAGIPIVGWHVGPKAGPMTGSPVAMNVSTDPLNVAQVTAMATVVGSKGRAGVVIFTDSNFEIALAKSNAMAEVIRACGTCELLEVRDVAISQSATLMPKVTRELLAKYGKRWTHALAINDIYFDYATPELVLAEKDAQGIELLSAGDGSNSAFLRIESRTFQTGTVAEPLNLHGWQLVDELNRLMSGVPVSGYVVPVHLVTPGNVAFDGGGQFLYDPDNGYRDVYRRIWAR